MHETCRGSKCEREARLPRKLNYRLECDSIMYTVELYGYGDVTAA